MEQAEVITMGHKRSLREVRSNPDNYLQLARVCSFCCGSNLIYRGSADNSSVRMLQVIQTWQDQADEVQVPPTALRPQLYLVRHQDHPTTGGKASD
jgi:hypothetical protein